MSDIRIEEDRVPNWLMRELNQIHSTVSDTQKEVKETNRKIDAVVLHQIAEMALNIATLQAEWALHRNQDFVTQAEFRPIKNLFWAVTTAGALAFLGALADLIIHASH